MKLKRGIFAGSALGLADPDPEDFVPNFAEKALHIERACRLAVRIGHAAPKPIKGEPMIAAGQPILPHRPQAKWHKRCGQRSDSADGVPSELRHITMGRSAFVRPTSRCSANSSSQAAMYQTSVRNGMAATGAWCPA